MSEMTDREQICRNCDRVVGPATRICSCGRPTSLASFKERSEWEVKQWRAYQRKLTRAR